MIYEIHMGVVTLTEIFQGSFFKVQQSNLKISRKLPYQTRSFKVVRHEKGFQNGSYRPMSPKPDFLFILTQINLCSGKTGLQTLLDKKPQEFEKISTFISIFPKVTFSMTKLLFFQKVVWSKISKKSFFFVSKFLQDICFMIKIVFWEI